MSKFSIIMTNLLSNSNANNMFDVGLVERGLNFHDFKF